MADTDNTPSRSTYLLNMLHDEYFPSHFLIFSQCPTLIGGRLLNRAFQGRLIQSIMYYVSKRIHFETYLICLSC